MTVAARVGTLPVVDVQEVSKTFGTSRVLDRASLEVLPGEVHGLLGQNGSGKSTLIKILAGFHSPDPGGTVRSNGHAVQLPLHPGQFRELGWAFVHQDLGLFPGLRVLDNLNLGRFPRSSSWRIRWRAEREEARRVLRAFNIDIDPDAPIADLSGAERAMVAIVRAAEEMEQAREHSQEMGRPGLLVLDEPTVFLPKRQAELLFALIRDVASRGAGVVFVSHQLSEVREITDRVTVLRDGRVHGTVVTREVTDDDLIELIVGRRLESLAAAHHEHNLETRPVVLDVRGLFGSRVEDMSFRLHEGEVLGLSGLVGSGFEDVPYHLFGALPARAGSASFGGAEVDLRRLRPAQAIRAGIALIPGDRAKSGGVGSFSVKTNITLPTLSRYFNGVRIDNRKERQDVMGLLHEFDVRPPIPTKPFGQLSGGNQQKALVAKWLHTAPRIVLVHEPTQGIDVGSRRQIYGVIRQLAHRGVATVCASADYEQLEALCDRVLVFRRGRVVAQLTGAAVTKERIAEQSFRSSQEELNADQ